MKNIARESVLTTNRNNNVKLPKIFIKKFYGDPIAWQQFKDSFEATINSNENLTEVEKFSYLKSYLSGGAEKTIDGISLTSENYEHAWILLTERYGNPHLVISSHMDQLLKLERLKSSNNVREFRSLYDKLESRLRSLLLLGIDS